ncbi:MAG TPA: PDZ domain-containing protein [Candidatus Polarisedimenticolia bacterium]|jgi:membrane-associated protease RseP (regulator of RpoE activity)|nr:PDZ domain-containing protein [Candidatus Polarisedimenticolia bacterium]
MKNSSGWTALDALALTALLIVPAMVLLPARASARDAGCEPMSDDPGPAVNHGHPTVPPSRSPSPLPSPAESPGSASSGSSSGAVHKKCPYSTQECLNTMAQRLKTAGWIGIEYDSEQPGYPKVQKVVPGSPAEKAGLQVGDELISLNGVEIKEGNEEKMKAARGDWTPGHTAHYVVKRKGALKPIDITLGTWPADVLARYIGEHMLEHAEADAQALAAIPAPKK